MPQRRLIFMGTPDFAAQALKALLAAGHEIAAIYTQPPRPSGRGRALEDGPVANLARQNNLPLCQPTSLKTAEEQARFASWQAEIAVVAAYGLLLPRQILALPTLGCLNIHASLLPRWRGAAPIQRALMAGDKETGISIMHMDEGLDTGPVLLQKSLALDPSLCGGALHDLLAELGARMMVDLLGQDTLPPPLPQRAEGVCYAHKLRKADRQIDWRVDAEIIERQIRALSPNPGAECLIMGERFKILAARLVRATPPKSPSPSLTALALTDLALTDLALTAPSLAAHKAPYPAPGEILDNTLSVACGGGGILALTQLQRAGRTLLSAQELLRGFPIAIGSRIMPT
jgi:methionyl-tRNA formyltransferase